MLVTLLRGSGCPGCSHCSGPCPERKRDLRWRV